MRKASNLTSGEALHLNVIDLISPNLPALLKTIDGRKTKPRGLTLHTAGDTIVTKEMGFFTRLLDTLIDPNLLSLLFLAGIGGILFEVFHPGVVLPGALGAVVARDRAVRLLGPADELGGRRADRARRSRCW